MAGLLLAVALFRRLRALDRCLAAFDGCFVTLERGDGRRWSGVLHLTETGLELALPADHSEAAYLLYAAEYDDVQALVLPGG